MTLTDQVYSTLQDAPGLTATEIATLIGEQARPSSVSTILCGFRNKGLAASEPSDKGAQIWHTTAPKEIAAREYSRKAPPKTAGALVVPGRPEPRYPVTIQDVIIQYGEKTYQLPLDLVIAIKNADIFTQKPEGEKRKYKRRNA